MWLREKVGGGGVYRWDTEAERSVLPSSLATGNFDLCPSMPRTVNKRTVQSVTVTVST